MTGMQVKNHHTEGTKVAANEQMRAQDQAATSEQIGVIFDKETFERLLQQGDRVYQWFEESQRSLHCVDDAELRIRCR